jgi:hypothetical protein
MRLQKPRNITILWKLYKHDLEEKMNGVTIPFKQDRDYPTMLIFFSYKEKKLNIPT